MCYRAVKKSVRILRFQDFLFRAWFYFRTGYSIYLAFLLGFFSNTIVIFKLAIEPIELSCTPASCPSLLGRILKTLFPSLTWFAILASAVAIPVGIYIGYFHMKRTGAFAAEASVGIEANPYVYKVVPGKEQEVFLPLMILTARGLQKVMERENMLTNEEKEELDSVLLTAEKLLAGHPVGPGRRGAASSKESS
jgi:hypothetical protein